MGILQANGLGFNVNVIVQFWIANFQKLDKFWDGNSLLFYEKSNSYDELCSILIGKDKGAENPCGFLGFRHKMVSMLTFFFARAYLIEPLHYPNPNDFHNIRVSLSTELVYTEDIGPGSRFGFEEVGEVLRRIIVEYCKDPDEILDLAK